MKPTPFFVQRGNIYAVPILHYNMEFAAQVKLAFEELKPDCAAVELPKTMHLQMLHAASRLPDISLVAAEAEDFSNTYYLAEPSEGTFEALRSALERKIPAFCIDLDVAGYKEHYEAYPDSYSITKIGLQAYYNAYLKLGKKEAASKEDELRELYMAKQLKALSYSYDKVFFVCGMFHLQRVLNLMGQTTFPEFQPDIKFSISLQTITDMSMREVLAEPGWFSRHYEKWREDLMQDGVKAARLLDRQQLLLQLYKAAAENYRQRTGNPFPGYNYRNVMKFVRNYAWLHGRLMPDLFKILNAAKGCVDHNYAYETWELATEYPYKKNIDNLPEMQVSSEQIWGNSKLIKFHLRSPGRKDPLFRHRRKDRSGMQFKPPGPFAICSYPPEDLIIENFGKFLQKKGTQLLSEESARTIPFSSSLEDGLDTRETIRHWAEHKLYVKSRGKPPGGVGSIVVVFHGEKEEEISPEKNKYSWKATWLGEHQQESDMAFYATPATNQVIGPGISRCEYGGFMMSYPPRRMFDVWSDPDYSAFKDKAEVLLAAAIDYAVKPLIVYVAASPPRTLLKNFARRYGKKIVYIPLGQLSPVTLNKIRTFHVLDGYGKRDIAGEYIY